MRIKFIIYIGSMLLLSIFSLQACQESFNDERTNFNEAKAFWEIMNKKAQITVENSSPRKINIKKGDDNLEVRDARDHSNREKMLHQHSIKRVLKNSAKQEIDIGKEQSSDTPKKIRRRSALKSSSFLEVTRKSLEPDIDLENVDIKSNDNLEVRDAINHSNMEKMLPKQLIKRVLKNSAKQEINRAEEQSPDITKKAKRRSPLTDSSFLVMPRKSLEEDKIDKNFSDFISNLSEFSYFSKDEIEIEPDPKGILIEALSAGIQLKKGVCLDDPLPPGNYAKCPRSPFLYPLYDTGETKVLKTSKQVRIYHPKNDFPEQGWKIHVFTFPLKAQITAALVMSVINRHIELADPLMKDSQIIGMPKYTAYKIIPDLALMRTLYYITGNLEGEGRETQVGKFITIYPSNRTHAAALTKTIDETLMWAIKGGILTKDDFVFPVGDAIVGESGGVCVRYGALQGGGNRIKEATYNTSYALRKKVPRSMNVVDPQGVPVKKNSTSLLDNTVLDNRFFPWPDYMNKGTWRHAPNPFPGQNLRWISPEGKIITWDNRPFSWSEIDGAPISGGILN